MRDKRVDIVCLATALLLVCSGTVTAQQADAGKQESADLAKQLANPVASLVSVPFQFNWEQNVGPSELTRFILTCNPSCRSPSTRM